MTDRIRFLLDDQLRELSDVDPTMTVLDYLRAAEHLPGTKEGCAEGDCGACTVVLGAVEGESIRYRAVNSCLLFLPVLDGKQLITVEHLRRPNGELHPIQRAMVECHASQCGFCTPGFVMALFELYQSDTAPTRSTINDALAGNLCRCTGYRPIVEAAQAACVGREPDQFSERETNMVRLLQSLRHDDTLEIAYGERRFYAPRTMAELVTLRQRHPNAHLLAGGTDLGLLVTKQHRDLDTVIYIGEVRELAAVTVDAGVIDVGAAATHATIIGTMARYYPDFAEILRRFGSPQIRNTATMVGNVANASPIGDSIPPLLALDARVSVRSAAGTREVAIHEFFPGYRQPALAEGEFVERLLIPIRDGDHRFAAYKISKRFDQDISTVCAAFHIELDGERVRDARVAYGGMAPVPKRAFECERRLIGSPWTEQTVTAAAAALGDDFTPITDFRGSAEYRALVARNLLHKFFLETTGRVTQSRLIGYGVA